MVKPFILADRPPVPDHRPSVPVNFRTLDLNLLRVFDEVMTERNLTRAGAHLAMTQPAVSNALRRLRDALHDELVVRAGYGVQPTSRALELWPAVRAALDTLRSAMQTGEFDAAGSRESFVLAMADATAALLMPPLVRRLEADAPGLSLRVRPLLTRDPRGLLSSGELDLAIGYFPAAVAAIDMASMQEGGPEPIEHGRLYDSRYVCVMRALPMDLPIVHVDQLWHRRSAARPAHAWLRRAVSDAAREAFEPPGAAAAGSDPAPA